jgi:putative spermidine/putrescine transport system permease protein
VWLLVIFAVPTTMLLASSFLRYDGATATSSLTLDNYSSTLSSAYARSVIWDTVWMSAVVAVASTLIGLLTAHYFVRSESRWRAVGLLIVVSPLVSSVVVRTYGWLVLLPEDGVVNDLLRATGLTDEPVRFIGSPWAVVVGLVHVLLPFAVFTLMSSFQGLDPALELAARDLGAGPVRTFFKVTLPLIMPGIVAGFTLVFAISLGAYATPQILGGGRLQTLATLVRERLLVSLEWGQAAAIAAIILGIGVAAVSLLMAMGRRSRLARGL